MKLRNAVTLCSLTTALVTSCTPTPSEQILHDMYTQLECAASSVDPSIDISHFKPKYYANPLDLEESYSLAGTFDDNGKSWNFYLTASQEDEEIKTRFSDDYGIVIITHSYFFGDDIEITGEKVWSPVAKEYFPEPPINKQEWDEKYNRFLHTIYEKVKKTCEENPFAHEIEDVQDHDAAIAKTTKPTLVYFHADWCGPCNMFESWYLRGFMAENKGTLDLVIANIGGEESFTTKPGWNELLDKNYGIEDYALPLVVFLGKDHSYKGHHIGNDSQFESNARISLLESKRNNQ